MEVIEKCRHSMLLPSMKIDRLVMNGSYSGLFRAVGGGYWLTPGVVGVIFGRYVPKNNPLNGS